MFMSTFIFIFIFYNHGWTFCCDVPGIHYISTMGGLCSSGEGMPSLDLCIKSFGGPKDSQWGGMIQEYL